MSLTILASLLDIITAYNGQDICEIGSSNPKGQIASTTFFLSYVAFKTTVISISVCVM